MNEYKIKATAPKGMPSWLGNGFTDWYQDETEAGAVEQWKEDAHRYGAPLDAVLVVTDLGGVE